MNPTFIIKRGDTLPLSGKLSIKRLGVDVAGPAAFAGWSMSCQLREGQSGALVHDLAPVLQPDGVFYGNVPSSVTEKLNLSMTYVMDIRVKDDTGMVMSSANMTAQFVKPISETP